MNILRNVLLFILTSLLVISCGGGTSGTGTTNPNNPPGPVDSLSKGSITGFGSVFVNGVEFETTSASITIDGISGKSQSDLRVGMVVAVEGSISGSTGTANNVIAEDILEGPVEQIINSNTIIVMGQTVLIDTNTLFDSNVPNFAGIQNADVLEISGHVKGNGLIAATYIEKKLTGTIDYEVKGFVQNHSHSTQSFTVGNLTINYATAVTTDMPAPSGNNWNTLLVKVKGSTLAGGTLTAVKVEPFGQVAASISKVELEGFVTAINSASSFTLENQLVQFDSSTLFEGGVATEIVSGSKLEAEGSYANGILTASKISFRDNIKFEADAGVIDVAGDSLTLAGLPGIMVTVDNLTEFKGSLNSLTDISAGNHLRIRGRELTGNVVIATEIEDRSSDTRVIIQAPVDSFVAPNVVVLGITVDTSTISEANFKDVSDNSIGSTAFFNSIATGKLVKARGNLGMAIIWDQVELEE